MLLIVISSLITPALLFLSNILLVTCNFPCYRRPTHERPGNLSEETKPPRHHLIQTVSVLESSRRSRFTVGFNLPTYRLLVDAEEETGGRVFGVSVRKCVLRCQWQWIRWGGRTDRVVCFQVSISWSNCSANVVASFGSEKFATALFCGLNRWNLKYFDYSLQFSVVPFNFIVSSVKCL